MPPKRNAADDLSDLRQRSRFDYLAKREALKLAELQKDVEEDEAERAKYGAQLSKREIEEMDRRKATLKLTLERNSIDDTNSGFFMLDSTLTDKSEVLTKRNKKENYKSEVQLWEEEQTTKARVAQGQQRAPETADDYEFVFDEAQAVKFDTLPDLSVLDPEKQRLQAQLDAAESRAKSIADVRESLPIYSYKDEILKAVDEHPVLVLTAETGSGKSSQIPQYMYSYLKSKGKADAMTVCTQPRRVAAISLATRVAEEHGTRLGDEVGYTIRFEDKSSDKTRIKYMTDGTLLRMFLTQPDLPEVGCIILDEAHERTLATDILMGLLKDVVKFRTDLKIIISSATMDAQAFSAYWDDCPVLFVPGRTYPVTTYYASQPEANYLAASVTTIMQIHISSPTPGDILCFFTGQEEIEAAMAAIEETKLKLGNRVKELICLPLYAALPSDDQQKVFLPAPPGARKVVLATNIAETSLTIDGIKYVIDTGFSKENAFITSQKIETLTVVPISRASANQRAGRAGRTGPGNCFRLFTEFSFRNEMPETSDPEILRVNLCSTILLLKSIGVNDLLNFPFMTPPAPESIAASLETLYCLGALDSKGSVTKIGRSLSELPIAPEQGKTLLSAEKFGCLNSVLSIIAMLGEANALFFVPKDKKIHADSAKRRFYKSNGLGDFGALCAIYNEFVESDYDTMWCKENFLQVKTLNRVRNVREQLEKLCERIGLTPSDEEGEPEPVAVQKAFVSGYFANSARMARDGQSYRTIKSGNQTVWIHPSSWVHEPTERPKWLIYNELVLTSKEFMRSVLPIKPEMLTELAPFYFKEADIEKLGTDKKVGKGVGKVGVDK